MSESVCLTVDRWRKSDIFSKPTLETSHASRTQSLGHGSVLPQALHVWKRAEGGRGHPVRRLCGAVFLTPVPPSSTFHPHSHSPPTDHRCLPGAELVLVAALQMSGPQAVVTTVIVPGTMSLQSCLAHHLALNCILGCSLFHFPGYAPAAGDQVSLRQGSLVGRSRGRKRRQDTHAGKTEHTG